MTSPARSKNGCERKSSPLVRKIAAEHGIELTGLERQRTRGTRHEERHPRRYRVRRSPARPSGSMYAPGGVETHGPPIEPWPGRSRRADDEDPPPNGGAHDAGTAHRGARDDVPRSRPHAIAKIRAAAQSGIRSANGREAHVPAVHHPGGVCKGSSSIPIINAAVSGERIIYRKAYNIGIAVALDWGLIVPVIKNADNLSLAGLTRALNDLANSCAFQKTATRKKSTAPRSRSPTTASSDRIAGTPIIPGGTSAILGRRGHRETAQGIAGRRRRGHDRDSHVRSLRPLLRSPHRGWRRRG